jgi:sulfur-oxidizing protein SoxX
MNRKYQIALTAAVAALLTACAAPMPTSADLDKLTQDILGRSFRAEGQAKLDRLSPDEDNRLCAEADRTGVTMDAKVAAEIEARNMKTIQAPADGKYLGDFK